MHPELSVWLTRWDVSWFPNEKNLTIAREQNPLTKLPGNILIHQYVSKTLQDIEHGYQLIYLDFDNFKPYNDTYGFRNGDRVILLFSDMLKKAICNSSNRFAGHIGGDDFFVDIQGEDSQQGMTCPFASSEHSGKAKSA